MECRKTGYNLNLHDKLAAFAKPKGVTLHRRYIAKGNKYAQLADSHSTTHKRKTLWNVNCQQIVHLTHKEA